MRSAAIAAVSFLAATAMAWLPQHKDSRADVCIKDDDAQTVAEHFKSLISAYTNDIATLYLSTDIHDYSDSVSTLINSGCPNGPATLGEATFTSRDAFEAGQGGQPNITFAILNVWHNCDTVTVRWKSVDPNPNVPGNPFAGAGPTPPEQVTGIVVLETVAGTPGSDIPFLISSIYSEFNSGAWLVDLGQFKPTNCSSSAAAPAKRALRPRML